LDAQSDRIRYFGRIAAGLAGGGADAEGISGAVFFNWSGSGFTFSFSGTGAEAELMTDLRDGALVKPESRAHIGVYLDGAPEPVHRFLLQTQRAWVALVEDLPEGAHTVRVVKLSEVGHGRAALLGLRLTGDAAASLPPLADVNTRRMEIIGDSISTGYGSDSAPDAAGFQTWEENALHTYGALAARMLQAQANIIAVSGIGIGHYYGLGTKNLMPELYTYTDKLLYDHYGSIPTKWDFASFRPDVIVVKMGSNDAQYCEHVQGITEPEKRVRREDFQSRYGEFIRQVRALNPSAEIFCLYDDRMPLRSEVAAAAESLRRQGDAKVHGWEVRDALPEEGLGADSHWSRATHARVAAELAAALRAAMGW
jgi:lysophospholipase L1-like esterase